MYKNIFPSFFALVVSVLLLSSCQNNPETGSEPALVIPAPPTLDFQLVNVYPHDTSSYTQGLIWEKGNLMEGTGEYGKSLLRINALKTGQAIKTIALPSTDFGEGITVLNNKIYQLTWQEHKIYVYDATTYKLIKTADWPYEGWGITHNGEQLIISTGGSNIYFVRPETFTIQQTIGVNDNNGYVDSINELEFAKGYIYANRYMTDMILKINPKNGEVVARIDASKLLALANAPFDPRQADAGNVLNGIAFRTDNGHFYLTGKKWPVLVEAILP
ncbi:MAG: glutaminyl-peptide cyclotransferase [Sphingobacteriia bacterium]|nr:MAG: glutaminyl-peptide cyclotransferase [Sphingobacteriia bacterium]